MVFFNLVNKLVPIFTASTVLISFQISEMGAIEKQDSQSSLEQLNLVVKAQTARLEIVKKLPNVGFGNIVADSVFIQFLQYFGDEEIRKKTGYSASPNFFEALLRHDPFYKEFYLFLSGSTTLYAANPEKTTQLTSENLEHLSPNMPSNSYYVWRYKAVDELLFLGDGKAAQQSFTSAANWAEESTDSSSENIGKLSRNTATFLENNPESRVAQIDAWSSLLTTALDKDTRNRAIERIEELGGSVLFAEDGGIRIQYEKAEVEPKTLRKPDI